MFFRMDARVPIIFQVIRAVFYVGPLIFAFGFLAPLISQILQALNITPPFGVSPLVVGLCVAAVLGGLAQWRGRWI